MKNEREVTTGHHRNTKNKKKPITDYYYYTPKKGDNWEEMDKFLETQYLPRLSQEEVEKFNRPITINELQSVIKKKKRKNSKQTKAQDQRTSQVSSNKYSKKS